MKKFIVAPSVVILAICLFAFTGASQPGVVIYDTGTGNMAIVAGNCIPLTNVVLQVTFDFTNWTAIATNTATLNRVTTFYVPKTNSAAFFRVYQ
jgi:hypothetical protein